MGQIIFWGVFVILLASIVWFLRWCRGVAREDHERAQAMRAAGVKPDFNRLSARLDGPDGPVDITEFIEGVQIGAEVPSPENRRLAPVDLDGNDDGEASKAVRGRARVPGELRDLEARKARFIFRP